MTVVTCGVVRLWCGTIVVWYGCGVVRLWCGTVVVGYGCGGADLKKKTKNTIQGQCSGR